MKRLMLRIYGDVQGVTFRVSMRKKAQELGIVGTVRNMDDGTVNVVAEGEQRALETLRDWCGIGPQRAWVEKIQELWEDILSPSFTEFRVIFHGSSND